jgi:hypothetical protein
MPIRHFAAPRGSGDMPAFTMVYIWFIACLRGGFSATSPDPRRPVWEPGSWSRCMVEPFSSGAPERISDTNRPMSIPGSKPESLKVSKSFPLYLKRPLPERCRDDYQGGCWLTLVPVASGSDVGVQIPMDRGRRRLTPKAAIRHRQRMQPDLAETGICRPDAAATTARVTLIRLCFCLSSSAGQNWCHRRSESNFSPMRQFPMAWRIHSGSAARQLLRASSIASPSVSRPPTAYQCPERPRARARHSFPA